MKKQASQFRIFLKIFEFATSAILKIFPRKWVFQHALIPVRMLILVVAIVAGIFGVILPTQAIGLSPGEVLVEDLAPGLEVERAFIVSSGAQRTEPLGLNIQIFGDAAQYITLKQGAYMEMAVGIKQLEIPFIIHSGNLPAGKYNAKMLVVETSAPKSDLDFGDDEVLKMGSRTLSGAQADINFTVTNEAVEKFYIQSVFAYDTEDNSTVKFNFDFINDGNVDTRPEKLDIKITDILDESSFFEASFLASDFDFTKAKTSFEYIVHTDILLDTGNYFMIAHFYDNNDEVIFTSNRITLQVYPEGTLAQEGKLTSFTVDKDIYEENEIVSFDGVFENTGTIGATASYVIELYKDGKRFDILKSEEKFIPIRRKWEFNETFRPSEKGKYTAIGYVKYGIGQTDDVELRFRVAGASGWSLYITLGILTMGLSGVLFVIYRRKVSHQRKRAA